MVESDLTPVCGIEARVVANRMICRKHTEIELVAAGFPQSQPGQFVQLQCAEAGGEARPRVLEWPAGGFPSLEGRDNWHKRRAYLRRPFSIADQWCDKAGDTHFLVISRRVGTGTTWLERLAPGESVNATGPLGHGFVIPSSDVPLVLIGGGVGIPPLFYLARRLVELDRRKVTAIFGATTRDLLPLRFVSEPAADGTPLKCAELAGGARFPTVITTDDGSCGMRGVVTDALRDWHSGCPERERESAVVFACGPEGMLQAVTGMTCTLGLGCQLCIERRMGCGLSTCLSCVVRVRDGSRAEGWRWALACSEGPVFERDQLWE